MHTHLDSGTRAPLLAIALAALTLLGCSSDDSDTSAQDTAAPAPLDTSGAPDTMATTDTPAQTDARAPTDSASPPPVYPDAGARPSPCPDPSVIKEDGHRTAPSKAACPADPPPWFTSGDPPAPTLEIKAGTLDESGEFAPWTDGQWSPVHWGMRMGAGVWMVLRVTLPGETADEVELELDTPGLIGCELIGTTLMNQAVFKAVPGAPGVYQFGTSQLSGACVLIAYTPEEVNAFCDHWMVVTARVRRPGTDTWGEVSNVIRLFIQP